MRRKLTVEHFAEPIWLAGDRVARERYFRELLQLIEQVGVLVTSDRSLLVAELDSVITRLGIANPASRPWQALRARITYGRTPYDRRCFDDAGLPSPSTISDEGTLGSQWGPSVDLIVVSPDYGNILGWTEGTYGRNLRGSAYEIELIRSDMVLYSEPYQAAFNNEAKHLDMGLGRAHFWQHIMQPLADYTEQVAICDPYAAQHFMRYWDAGCPSPSSTINPWTDSALTWLLRNLNSSGRSKAVHLHLSASSKMNNSCYWGKVLNAITAFCRSEFASRGAIDTVKLWLNPDTDFPYSVRNTPRSSSKMGRSFHDRHIRFDHHTLTIGRGLDVFNNEPLLYPFCDWNIAYFPVDRTLSPSRRVDLYIQKEDQHKANCPHPIGTTNNQPGNWTPWPAGHIVYSR